MKGVLAEIVLWVTGFMGVGVFFKGVIQSDDDGAAVGAMLVFVCARMWYLRSRP